MDAKEDAKTIDVDLYTKFVRSIIEHQESIIGPLAVEQAKSVTGLSVDWAKKAVTISGEPTKVIDALVEQYKQLFGQISVEVCKEAVGRLAQQLSSDQMPASLR